MKQGLVLHCAAFAAPYAGNFIRSLCALEECLLSSGMRMAYVFPSNAKKQVWWKEFSTKHQAYCTESISERGKGKELAEIIKVVDPVIIHTHFEGYDVAASMAVKICSSKARIVWHMHDVLAYHQNPLKRLYQYFCFFRHYSYYGKGVSAIGVSKQILEFTSKYRRLLGGSFLRSEVIVNGVDSSRLSQRKCFQEHKPFTFLTFGGRNVQKRVDLLLDAASRIYKDNNIRVLITNGTDTEQVVSFFFNGQIPDWCVVIPQSDDINYIFDQADCFVSTSVYETFSYAICEASVYGLPILQSDIEGTKWNAGNPSTYVFRSEDTFDLESNMKKVMSENPLILSVRIKETQSINIRDYSLNTWCGKIVKFYEDIIIDSLLNVRFYANKR